MILNKFLIDQFVITLHDEKNDKAKKTASAEVKTRPISKSVFGVDWVMFCLWTSTHDYRMLKLLRCLRLYVMIWLKEALRMMMMNRVNVFVISVTPGAIFYGLYLMFTFHLIQFCYFYTPSTVIKSLTLQAHSVPCY